jgi:hypothetical protein
MRHGTEQFGLTRHCRLERYNRVDLANRERSHRLLLEYTPRLVNEIQEYSNSYIHHQNQSKLPEFVYHRRHPALSPPYRQLKLADPLHLVGHFQLRNNSIDRGGHWNQDQ